MSNKKQQSVDYNIHEPTIGHFNRFQAKLEKEQQFKPKKKWLTYIAIAASIVLLVTLSFGKRSSEKGFDLADVSPKMEETQDYFTTAIHQEMEKIKLVENTQNKKIIDDAFVQLQFLEKDYESQKIALSTNTENKNIIYAMINNYQKRIDVLQNLLTELNKFNHLKNQYNETNNL